MKGVVTVQPKVAEVKSKSSGETLDRYKEFLAIDKDALDDCLIEQPECFYHVARSLVLASSDRDAAKLAFEELQAKLDQDLRAKAIAAEEKMTESALQNKLRTLPAVQDSQRTYLEARQAADEWLALKEAFSQRSFMLRELVALYIAQRHDSAMEGGAGQARASLSEQNRVAANNERKRRRLVEQA